MEEQCLALLRERLNVIFTRFKEGKDVAPAYRFQTEGMMLMGLSLQCVNAETLILLQQQCFQSANPGIELPAFKPTELPVFMRRAPVKPTTKG